VPRGVEVAFDRLGSPQHLLQEMSNAALLGATDWGSQSTCSVQIHHATPIDEVGQTPVGLGSQQCVEDTAEKRRHYQSNSPSPVRGHEDPRTHYGWDIVELGRTADTDSIADLRRHQWGRPARCSERPGAASHRSVCVAAGNAS